MISDRIEALISHFCKGNKSLFAQQIGVRPSVIGNITGERNGNPSFEVIQKILDAFASVSPDWFILDKGSMLRVDQEQPMAQLSSSIDESIIYKMYKEKDLEVKELMETIGSLKEQIRQLKRGKENFASDVPNSDTANVG